MSQIKRDTSIDFLKSLGMFLIIIAHSNPPEWLFVFRTFDVPLLIFISASTFTISSNSKVSNLKSYINYLYKRFKRLVIPTWFFLFIYFVFFESIDLVTHNRIIDFSLREILTSFSLLSGIGFVWIIRVYILIAFLAPIMKLVIKDKLHGYFIICMLFFMNFVLYYYFNTSNYLIHLILTEIILYATGYGVIFVAGIIFYKLTKKEVLFNIFLLILGLFIYFLVIKKFDLQFMKYPPRMLYLIYGILMSNILVLFSKIEYIKNVSRNKFFYFFSKYSLDIYFIHIFPVQILFYKIVYIPKNNFLLRFVFIVTITFLLSYIYINKENLFNIVKKKGSNQ